MTSSSDATDHPKPAVEPSPATADSTTRALQQRIRQQEILAELGVVALQGKPFLELLSETVRLTAEGMNAEFCKVLEFIPADNRLLVRAGVGWHEGIVGRATVGTYAKSSATWSRRSRLPKSSLMLPKPFVLRRIVRFLLGSSSMSLSRMRGSMLTQIVPVVRFGCGLKRKTSQLRFRFGTKASVYLLVLTQPPASGWARAWSPRFQNN